MPSIKGLENKSDRGLERSLSNAETVTVNGVTFTGADAAADFKFEPSHNLDDLVSTLIASRGVTGAIDALTVNGGKADAFRLVWDHLDDNYSYYNTAVNDAFVDLGIAYAQYLLEGGEPLLDVAKFQPDSAADADLVPERLQTLHDNILGNFDEASITDKFGPAGDDAIFARIQAAGLGELIGEIGVLTDGRGVYGGYDTQNPTAVRLFDEAFFG